MINEDFYTKNYLKDHIAVKSVGKYTYGKPILFHWGEPATLSIGNFCSIADNVKIFLGGNHRVDWLTTYPFNVLSDYWHTAKEIQGHPMSKGDVIIGNDVWIGYGATILSGIKIGDGAVIGAESVITKDVPPYTIVAGNPATIIRKRFKNSEIKKLLDLKWWDWDESKILNNLDILCSNKMDKLFEKDNKFFKRFW